MADQLKPPLLKLLVVIVDREKGKKLAEILHEEHVHFQYITSGVGTANSEILDLLGLGGVEKTVAICLEVEAHAPLLMDRLHSSLKLDRPGHGIAFTMPLSGVCSIVSHRLTKEMQQARERLHHELEKEVEKMTTEAKQDLIIAVVNQGFSDDLMDAAKTAGATGGTILHAHRIGIDDSAKFLGISVQAEKEIVAIITRREEKMPIMRAINQACGVQTEARGIVFSMPVDSIAGLNFSE